MAINDRCYSLGQSGVKRFCSERYLDNYCTYVQRPGDSTEYRSCVYTCEGDGCNGSAETPNANKTNNTTDTLLSCYQCDSTEDVRCNEDLTNKTIIPLLPCSTISEPRYCVKMTGIFGGQYMFHFAYDKSLGKGIARSTPAVV